VACPLRRCPPRVDLRDSFVEAPGGMETEMSGSDA
jgi:hypothetical protein